MKPLTVEEEKQQQFVIVQRRQWSLLWLGVCVLALWAIPHPHQGAYQFPQENGLVSGGFPEITLARWWIGLAGWAAAVSFLVQPLYVRWRWRKWFPLGY